MTSNCIDKLLKDGWQILRVSDSPSIMIKQCTGSFGSWSIYKKFDTKAERHREVVRLRNEDNKVIFDSIT
jgi:hypothetical protein